MEEATLVLLFGKVLLIKLTKYTNYYMVQFGKLM